MRWIASLLFPCFALTAAAQISVPQGTRVRVRASQYVIPHRAGTAVKLPVSEPVIVSGAVVIDRNAGVIARIEGARSALIPERVQSVDGSWIELTPDTAQPPDPDRDWEFVTARPAVVDAPRLLRFETVDPVREKYLRLGMWVLDANRSWALLLFDSGSSVISLSGVALIAIGSLYRWSCRRREGA